MVASGVAIYFVSQLTLDRQRLLLGSLLMGAGIITMHYTGMAAMRLQASIVYDPWLVVGSMIIAVVVSFVGLRLAFTLRSETLFSGFMKKMGGAMIIGCAIPSMHLYGNGRSKLSSTPNCRFAIFLGCGYFLIRRSRYLHWNLSDFRFDLSFGGHQSPSEYPGSKNSTDE